MSGDVDGAFNLIENYWGKMLEFGATTFWEDFDVEWTKNAYGIDEMPQIGKVTFMVITENIAIRDLDIAYVTVGQVARQHFCQDMFWVWKYWSRVVVR